MKKVGIRELKRKADELVHFVHETGSEIQIAYHGKVVVLLVPSKPIIEILKMPGKNWMTLQR